MLVRHLGGELKHGEGGLEADEVHLIHFNTNQLSDCSLTTETNLL